MTQYPSDDDDDDEDDDDASRLESNVDDNDDDDATGAAKAEESSTRFLLTGAGLRLRPLVSIDDSFVGRNDRYSKTNDIDTFACGETWIYPKIRFYNREINRVVSLSTTTAIETGGTSTATGGGL